MSSIEELVLKEKNLYSLSEAKNALFGNFLLMGIVTMILNQAQFPIQAIITWICAMTLLSVYRIFYLRSWLPKLRHNAEEIDQKQILIHSNLYLMTMGILWSFAYVPIILYSDSHLDYLVLTIIIGFSGASIYSSGASFQTFLFLNSAPIFGAFFAFSMDSNPESLIALAITCLSIVFIGTAAWRFSNHFRENMIKNENLTQAKNEIIRALGRAGEYRDEETGNHVIRMSHSCYLLAREIGYNEDQAQIIKSAATLHDVGKIGIPDAILLKEGKLSDLERKMMQEHVNIGVDILSMARNSEIISTARIIAQNHHERGDGKGYPNGLYQEAIPIEGRIASLCDVYDALTSERPYKKAWTPKEAIEYICRESGGAFDPHLVPHFLAILPEIRRFRQTHQDDQEVSLSSVTESLINELQPA